MSEPEADREDDFAALLAAYDAQLATGNLSAKEFEATSDDVPDEFAARLRKAKKCLLLLEQAWPRAKLDEQPIPATLGRFRIERELGPGGFGIV